MSAYREKVIHCDRGGTYKYFLERERVMPTWSALAASYGELRRDPVMHTMEIKSAALIFRATLLGNPITVFRRPPCTGADVDAFHALIGFEEAA